MLHCNGAVPDDRILSGSSAWHPVVYNVTWASLYDQQDLTLLVSLLSVSFPVTKLIVSAKLLQDGITDGGEFDTVAV